ncbi:MAG: hypothetical protein LDL50_03190 [Chloroflexi bacterium]|nr:hypothetical protein [Chloroflexota bacterium]MCA2002248.1 hypothetical protein [Chloroflexota bacterium]
MDTGSGYSSTDAHLNIEKGFPTPQPSPSTPAPTAFQDGKSASPPLTGIHAFIPITGTLSSEISCGVSPFVLALRNNERLTFDRLCAHDAVVESFSSSQNLTQEPPQGARFLSALSISLAQNGTPLERISQNAVILWKVPAGDFLTVSAYRLSEIG